MLVTNRQRLLQYNNLVKTLFEYNILTKTLNKIIKRLSYWSITDMYTQGILFAVYSQALPFILKHWKEPFSYTRVFFHTPGLIYIRETNLWSSLSENASYACAMATRALFLRGGSEYGLVLHTDGV